MGIRTIVLMALVAVLFPPVSGQGWIRINQVGYLPESVKVAVFIGTREEKIKDFALCDAITGRVVFRGPASSYSGSSWGMKSAARLDFSAFEQPGGYYLAMNGYRSPVFRIGADVYAGSAEFILKYMRQQRCGDNPWLDDSCHVHDGMIVDHPTRTGEVIDVTGGWHDASDYLQYLPTSANAVYQMMFAWMQNPDIYGDRYDASGRPAKNGVPDILDEAMWGLDWMLKMNPDSGVMFNQIADDRDHRGFRLPTLDTVSYGLGPYRPVYFVTGKPQGLARFKNRTEGVSSTAGKYASAFALAARVFGEREPEKAELFATRARQAFAFGLTDLGATQTACNVSPYFYEEDNYVDDLQLGAWELFRLTGEEYYLKQADYWGNLEPVTPWIVKDTARHYQYYPFVNLGHANIGMDDNIYSDKYLFFMRQGLRILRDRRTDDPFRVTVPFTWCSSNFVNAALTQHLLYRGATGDSQFIEAEAALRDWLFGCNPWGTSMICGYPEGGDYPRYPHSAFTLHLGVTTEGGLIDGPVYTSIFSSLIGIKLLKPDDYAIFQHGKAVYHDDIGDYSTNEPTMDGTANLSVSLALLEREGLRQATGRTGSGEVTDAHGAVVRIDSNRKEIYLVFSADELGEGMAHVLDVLKNKEAGGSFFLTGNYLRNSSNKKTIARMKREGHFIGPHSDKHLLYAAWEKRDTLLVTKDVFIDDLRANYVALAKHGIDNGNTRWFLAPYEWYNSTIATWTSDLGVRLLNFTPGTGTNADYTTPAMPNYKSSDVLIEGLNRFEASSEYGLNGAIILIHPGTEATRSDKLYLRLGEIIDYYRSRGYSFKKL